MVVQARRDDPEPPTDLVEAVFRDRPYLTGKRVRPHLGHLTLRRDPRDHAPAGRRLDDDALGRGIVSFAGVLGTEPKLVADDLEGDRCGSVPPAK